MSSSDIRRFIDKLKSDESRSSSIEDLKTTVGELIAFCPFEPVQNTRRMRFFRVQKLDDESFCENVARMSYPPKHLVKSHGRANRSGSTILYVSHDPQTAIFESHLEPGDYFAVAEFELRAQKQLNLLQAGISGRTFGSLSVIPNVITEKNLQRMGLNKYGVRNVFEIHRTLGELFMRDVPKGREFEYAITVAIAEQFLGFELADGLLYPSARSSTDCNVAFKPESADDKLVVKKIAGFRGIEIVGTTVKVQHFATSATIGDDGNIEWIHAVHAPPLDWPNVK